MEMILVYRILAGLAAFSMILLMFATLPYFLDDRPFSEALITTIKIMFAILGIVAIIILLVFVFLNLIHFAFFGAWLWN